MYISAPLIYYNLLLACDLVISFIPEIYPKEIKMDEYVQRSKAWATEPDGRGTNSVIPLTV